MVIILALVLILLFVYLGGLVSAVGACDIDPACVFAFQAKARQLPQLLRFSCCLEVLLEPLYHRSHIDFSFANQYQYRLVLLKVEHWKEFELL